MVDKPEVICYHELRDERDTVVDRRIQHEIMAVCTDMLYYIEEEQIDNEVEKDQESFFPF